MGMILKRWEKDRMQNVEKENLMDLIIIIIK